MNNYFSKFLLYKNQIKFIIKLSKLFFRRNKSMTRKPRRTPVQIIQDKITKVEENIISLQNRITALEGQKKELEEELATAQDAENKEREQKELQDLATLIKAKKLSVDDIKAMIEEKNATESQVAATEES